MLQQHLPFTVLKRYHLLAVKKHSHAVATAPTVYGIETRILHQSKLGNLQVATAPTVYGIETREVLTTFKEDEIWLQQHLPFTVLKRTISTFHSFLITTIGCNSTYRLRYWNILKAVILIWWYDVATALTVYGIETQ